MYAALADMQARFGEDELIVLTDRAQAGVIDQAVLDGALADATATIDGYLAGRYPLPLAQVPPVLVRLCCDLTRYYLYDEQATDQVTKRHDAALKMLDQMASGAISLGLDAADAPEGSNLSEIQSAGTVWARANSQGFL
ncbi:DUF1320 family protein [Gallaecimonas kandeliae]|uniref:gp436 family protein n=1 Tax=Gallaecimonas kandeliae TaxID=3029055 RepID=UPI002648EEA6|nr:phage protein Gp36 family protein [Gallaecimonas kandeliae]WKE64337.1 DUF1320 family protein [Gallaecimonas kandeliae]